MQLSKLRKVHPARDLSQLQVRVLGVPMAFSWNRELVFRLKGQTWATTLDQLKASDEWDRSRNRVAILGCGAYGLPLANHAKQRNMSAVYVGGLLPLLFGVHSSPPRIDSALNGLAAANNSHWMPPLPQETPAGRSRLEHGAYW